MYDKLVFQSRHPLLEFSSSDYLTDTQLSCVKLMPEQTLGHNLGQARGDSWGAVTTLICCMAQRGLEGDALEVECAEEHIVLYRLPGSMVTLFHAGKEAGAGTAERAPVPLTPSV